MTAHNSSNCADVSCDFEMASAAAERTGTGVSAESDCRNKANCFSLSCGRLPTRMESASTRSVVGICGIVGNRSQRLRNAGIGRRRDGEAAGGRDRERQLLGVRAWTIAVSMAVFQIDGGEPLNRRAGYHTQYHRTLGGDVESGRVTASPSSC